MPRKLTRINTEPEIRKLKRGGHAIRYRIPAHDGKPETKSPWRKYPDAKTKGQALQCAEQYRQELEDEANNYAAHSDLAFGQYAQKWHEDREDGGDIIGTTWARERTLIAAIQQTAIAEIPIEEITEDDIKQFKADARRAGWSTDKQRKTYNKLRQILKHAERQKLIRNDPARHVAPVKTRAQERKTLTREQQHALLEALHTEPKDGRRAAVLIALATGLRLGETLGLIWDDLDDQQRTLTIRRQLGREGRTRAPKNDSTGIIPLDDSTYNWLDDWRQQTYNEIAQAGQTDDITARMLKMPICRNSKYEYQQHTNFERWFRKFSVDHGLGTYENIEKRRNGRGENETHRTGYNGITFHELRHTMATETLSSGADLQTTRAIMRHKSIRTTGIYLHNVDENLVAAVQNVARMREQWTPENEQAQRKRNYETISGNVYINPAAP